MLTDRFKALEEAIGRLPPDVQDALADALEDALRQTATSAPPATLPQMSPDVRAAIDRALAQHAASLAYLKDK